MDSHHRRTATLPGFLVTMEIGIPSHGCGNTMSNTDTPSAISSLPAAQWLTQRAQYATRELGDCVEVNPEKLGGVPVLKGTRVSVAQILAEIGEGQTTEQVADDFQLDAALVKKLVRGLAVCLDRSASP